MKLWDARLKIIISAIVVLSLIGSVLVLSRSVRESVGNSLSAFVAQHTKAPEDPFPEINTTQLSPTQRKIISLSNQEYRMSPVSFDNNVLKYTEGNKEPWCADYISWLLKESGAPLSNQDSGHWRIPGVLSLQKYYKDNDNYRNIGEYTPKTGDVAIYIGNRTLDGRSRQHTNIVLKAEGDTMTTIGGNEAGRLRISTQKFNSNENSLVGFGIL